MPQEHRLKVLIDFFPALASGEKSFELRFDDRGYRVGDTLRLMEWTGVRFTGREVVREITFILAGKPWLEKNYVALSLRAVQQPDANPSAKPFKCPHCGSHYFGPTFRGKEIAGRYCKGWPSGYDRSYNPCPAKHVEWYEQAPTNEKGNA